MALCSANIDNGSLDVDETQLLTQARDRVSQPPATRALSSPLRQACGCYTKQSKAAEVGRRQRQRKPLVANEDTLCQGRELCSSEPLSLPTAQSLGLAEWEGLGPYRKASHREKEQTVTLEDMRRTNLPEILFKKKTHITVTHPQRLLPQYQSVYEWLGNDMASSWLPHRFIGHGLFGL